MPRYFFDLHDRETDPDSEGIVLPDEDAARARAIVFAGDLLSNEPGLIRGSEQLCVAVSDESGKTLFRIAIAILESDGMAA